MRGILKKKTVLNRQSYSIWLIGVTFVLLQFLLQMSSGIVLAAVATEYQFNSFEAGILGAGFYYVYTLMQIPVGILFDRKSARTIITYSSLTMSVGCFLFFVSTQFNMIFLSRLIMGAGASFAFVGLSHFVRQYFQLKQFSFWIGLSETMVLFGVMASTFFLGKTISSIGYRPFIVSIGLCSLCISMITYYYVPNFKPLTQRHFKWLHLKKIMTNPIAWINGFYVGASFTIVSVFGGMWSVLFLQSSMHVSLSTASRINALLFLGTAISCPLFGKVVMVFRNRRVILFSSCFISTILMSIILYCPIQNSIVMSCLFLLLGLVCGAYMIAYEISNELAPPSLQSTATGFTNTLAVLTAPIYQPIIGYLTDFYHTEGVDLANAYRFSLSIIPISLLIACILIIYLPRERQYTNG
jgi:MFS family permease